MTVCCAGWIALMMGLNMPETCRGWWNILRISCASSWFSFTRLYRDAWSTKHKISKLSTYVYGTDFMTILTLFIFVWNFGLWNNCLQISANVSWVHCCKIWTWQHVSISGCVVQQPLYMSRAVTYLSVYEWVHILSWDHLGGGPQKFSFHWLVQHGNKDTFTAFAVSVCSWLSVTAVASVVAVFCL
jgi:hypothetical protein